MSNIGLTVHSDSCVVTYWRAEGADESEWTAAELESPLDGGVGVLLFKRVDENALRLTITFAEEVYKQGKHDRSRELRDLLEIQWP